MTADQYAAEVDVIKSAVRQLDRSERGERMRKTLAGFLTEYNGLDLANKSAVRHLFTINESMPGTVYDELMGL